jgi:Rieske 2Fe-2S family protein
MQADSANSSRIAALIAARRPGFSLERDFYFDPSVYRLDIETIWRRDWLFAGHSCEAARPGDFFAFELDGDPLLIVRGDDGTLRALHNVCRHRGSILCEAASGRVGRLVCPYHQWTYGRDGALVAARGMPADFDRAGYSLAEAHLRELQGLVFVCLAEEPPDFEPAAAALAPLLKPQGFGRAKVAAAVDYDVEGNWKLVWENNRECYHCDANHPEYIQANFDRYNADDATPRIRNALAAAVARSEAKWAELGLAATHREPGMVAFPDGGVWYSANRTPLVEGFVSETLDGQRVAPLMGDYPDADVGTLRIRALPNFWNHSSCDHGVSTRLLPAGPERTRVRVTWLVDEDAEEGRDYQPETLLPFWRLTSEQDWAIVANAGRGVASRAYRPGPFSTVKEYNVEAFVRWYLGRVASGLG